MATKNTTAPATAKKNDDMKATAEKLRAAAKEARHGDVRAAVAAIAETMADAIEQK